MFEEKYDSMRQRFNDAGISKGKTTDEYLFTVCATDLFFYDEDIGLTDITTQFIDGSNDGGIDFIYSDGETMYLIQGKSTNSLTFNQIRDAFTKMATTVSNFKNDNIDNWSSKLKQAFIEAYDGLNENKNIELVLFTNTTISDSMRDKILGFSQNSEIDEFKIDVYDPEDMMKEEALRKKDFTWVEEDKIEMYKDPVSNLFSKLSYGDSGIIVNVKASSIKHLYDRHNGTGIFSYNLREHIGQRASVDEKIKHTIDTPQEKDNFWFYNNGITIGCKDFRIDGNNIKLYDFSIINGAQTTTLIGKSKKIKSSSYDFAVVCKIVKAPDSDSENSKFIEFINTISEAANTQKPIKSRDLKANKEEQKMLQISCADNGDYSLAVDIKQGLHADNYKKMKDYSWRRVTNEYLGQLIYACLLQHPGTARNSKDLLFSSETIYKQVYKRQQDCDTLFDLVKIGHVYDEFKNDYVKKENDVEKVSVVKYGKYTILAVLIYFVKKHRGIIKSDKDKKSYEDKALYKDNIRGFLITDYPYNDWADCLIDLFRCITAELKNIFDANQTKLKLTSYTNFFKSDNTYKDVILAYFEGMESMQLEPIESRMKVFYEKEDDTK